MHILVNLLNGRQATLEVRADSYNIKTTCHFVVRLNRDAAQTSFAHQVVSQAANHAQMWLTGWEFHAGVTRSKSTLNQSVQKSHLIKLICDKSFMTESALLDILVSTKDDGDFQ